MVLNRSCGLVGPCQKRVLLRYHVSVYKIKSPLSSSTSQTLPFLYALIACFDAKYHYLFWRPFSSIPQADTDGNPMTESDPSWAPLLGTPPHPEYPSAHGCLTSAAAEVLAEFLGTNHINIDVPSTIAGLFPNGRHYDSVNDLTKEVIDARVWAGIHYRESDIKGVTLGRKVAHWTLKRYFLPENK